MTRTPDLWCRKWLLYQLRHPQPLPWCFLIILIGKEGKKERKNEGFELLFINLSCYFSYFLLLAPVPRHTAPRSSKMLSYKFNLFSPFKKIRGKLTRNVFQKLAILSLCFCLFLVYSINNIISQQLNVKTSYIQTHKVSI